MRGSEIFTVWMWLLIASFNILWAIEKSVWRDQGLDLCRAWNGNVLIVPKYIKPQGIRDKSQVLGHLFLVVYNNLFTV